MRILPLLPLLAWAWAHQPFWNPGSPGLEAPYRVLDPGVAQVITGRLNPGGWDYYLLELPPGFTLDASLFVGAVCPPGFQPRLWLLGPGIQGEAAPPFPLPPGVGARAYSGGWRDYRGHGLVARRGPAFRETLPGGRHHLVVEAGAAGGYYLLSLNGREVPGGTAEGRAALGRFNRCGA